MRVYFNDAEYVVAESVADAANVLIEEYGLSQDEVAEMDWTVLPDDRVIRISYPDDNPPHTETKTAREWADISPRGVLCSTEY